jgi:hypothetical protein
MSTSVFDQAWQRERPARAFEDLFDPASRRQLAERGIRPGWRCLEVGATYRRHRDDEALHAPLHHLTVVRDALAAAPTDLPPPAPRRTPPTSAVPKPSHGAGSPCGVCTMLDPHEADHSMTDTTVAKPAGATRPPRPMPSCSSASDSGGPSRCSARWSWACSPPWREPPPSWSAASTAGPAPPVGTRLPGCPGRPRHAQAPGRPLRQHPRDRGLPGPGQAQLPWRHPGDGQCPAVPLLGGPDRGAAHRAAAKRDQDRRVVLPRAVCRPGQDAGVRPRQPR